MSLRQPMQGGDIIERDNAAAGGVGSDEAFIQPFPVFVAHDLALRHFLRQRPLHQCGQ